MGQALYDSLRIIGYEPAEHGHSHAKVVRAFNRAYQFMMMRSSRPLQLDTVTLNAAKRTNWESGRVPLIIRFAEQYYDELGDIEMVNNIRLCKEELLDAQQRESQQVA